MKLGLSIVFFSLWVLTARGGQTQFTDSLRVALQSKPHFVIGLNNRFASVSGEPSRTTRLFAGLDYNKKIRFEFAYNVMPKAAVSVDYLVNGDTLLRTNQLGYIGLQAEYTLHRSKHWKVSLPIQLGLGGNTTTRRLNGSLESTGQSTVVPLESGLNGVYYFYDWIGIKAGLGLRMAFGGSFSTLSGPYYNLGLGIFAGELYRRIKNKN